VLHEESESFQRFLLCLGETSDGQLYAKQLPLQDDEEMAKGLASAGKLLQQQIAH
jgi:hypothetical protein